MLLSLLFALKELRPPWGAAQLGGFVRSGWRTLTTSLTCG
jgi:hypothetical protein